ncbi:MAG TPA: LysR family transcriptional regulator [Caulobacteraceae bacterium]
MNEFDKSKIRNIDGGLLLIFRELLLRRRASDVADQLGLSPSAISHALSRLRDIFDEPLFIRRSRGLEPTLKALELGPRIEALIGQLDAVLSTEPSFDPAQSRRRFRLACPDDVVSLLGPGLVDRFRRDAPHAAFSSRPAILDRALRAVRRGEVDAALGVFRQVPRGLEAHDLYQDDYAVIARQGHPKVRGFVDAVTYATAGHVFVGNPDGALGEDAALDREAIDETYGRLPGPELVRTHAYVSQWETAMLIVAGGDALADCPRRLAERHAGRLGLQVLAPPFAPFSYTVQVVCRRELDAGVTWLLAQLRDAVAAES